MALFEHGNECVSLCSYTICVALVVTDLTISTGAGDYKLLTNT